MKITTLLRSSAFAALLVGAVVASAQDDGWKTYTFGTHVKHTNVTFVSEADVETINGSTNTVSGQAELNLEKGKGKCSITIPVKDMKTGIASRDEHMQNDMWLDSAKYPNIIFKSDDLKVKNAKKKLWTAKGKITIHGITKDLTTEFKVIPIPAKLAKVIGKGEWLKVSTSFDVKLSDFDVKGHAAGVIGPKVSPVWKVKFQCFAVYQKDTTK